jgi:hypothetical protein
MELPKPDLIVQQAPTDSPALILGDTYGFSFPNAIYQAETKDASGLVALVVDLLHYSPGERTLVVPEICHTFHIYDKELVPLQGRCVPRFAGLFGHGSLYCAVFEDAGDRITYEEREQKEIRYVLRWRELTRSIEIIQAILEIEQAKVGPVLNQWRFIRRGQDGRIKIVPESVVSLGKYQSMPAPPGDSRSPEERITEVCKGRKHSAHEIFEVYERDDDPKYIWCCDWS